MIRHGLGRLGHRLQEVVLSGQIAPRIGTGFPGAMDPRLAGRRGDTDRNVLHRTAEAAHRMTFEVRQDDRKVVVEEMRADEIFSQVPAARDRKSRLTLGIHDIDRSDRREPMIGGGLQVIGRTGPPAAVGRIALDDRAADLANQITDQGRLQEMVPARFAGREFDGDLARRLAPQRFVDAHECLRRDLARKINLRFRRLRSTLAARTSPAAERHRRKSHQKGHIPNFFHGVIFLHIMSVSGIGPSSGLRRPKPRGPRPHS